MELKQFLNHNGHYFETDQPLLTVNNRAFCYGDSLFETLRFTNFKTQFLQDHLQRLFNGMTILKMHIPEQFTETFFDESISKLAKKNGITSDGRIKITIYRNQGGLYAPDDNTISYLMECSPLEENGYTLNFKGYTVDLYSDLKKSQSVLSSIKSGNSAIYVMAGIHKNINFLDECILMNEKGNITEAISSNIFAVKNGVLYTPPIADGCINGVMRKKIIEIAKVNIENFFNQSSIESEMKDWGINSYEISVE